MARNTNSPNWCVFESKRYCDGSPHSLVFWAWHPKCGTRTNMGAKCVVSIACHNGADRYTIMYRTFYSWYYIYEIETFQTKNSEPSRDRRVSITTLIQYRSFLPWLSLRHDLLRKENGHAIHHRTAFPRTTVTIKHLPYIRRAGYTGQSWRKTTALLLWHDRWMLLCREQNNGFDVFSWFWV